MVRTLLSTCALHGDPDLPGVLPHDPAAGAAASPAPRLPPRSGGIYPKLTSQSMHVRLEVLAGTMCCFAVVRDLIRDLDQ